MAEYIARRRLYRGAGDFVAKGEKVDLTPAEAEPLLSSGAVEKAGAGAAAKKAPAHANKAEGSSAENKAKK